MGNSEDLLVDIQQGVATLTFNRPDRLNALSRNMIDEAVSLLRDYAVNPDIGCIVLTGAGRGFCAGGDVQAMHAGRDGEMSFEEKLDRQRLSHQLSAILYTMPKVTIAAINGPAAGAGMAIALACDFRIASDQAKLTTAFAKVGFGGDFGITWPLTRIVGEAKAKELLFLSNKITSQQAHELGLVNRVVAHDELLSEVNTLANQIAAGPQVSYRYMKENVRLSSEQDYISLLDREAWTQLRCGETDDHKEGARAFVEKRPPKFTGR